MSQFGAPATSRETTDPEHRARARERVQRLARKGKSPAAEFSADDLAWAFKDRKDELQQLEELAETSRQEHAERDRRREENTAIRSKTEQVLREWDETEQAERRAKAEAEARKRLGLS